MTQSSLFCALPQPTVPDWCDLRLGDVGAGLADLAAAGVRVDLVVADPPWAYAQKAGSASSAASEEYGCLRMGEIVEHLGEAYWLANVGARCLLWTTWAMLPALTGFARAVAKAGGGRRYIGFEIDSGRHSAALALLASTRGNR